MGAALYTDTLDASIRASVRMIHAGGLNGFRSHIAQDPHAGQLVWREAVLNPVSSRWTLKQCSAMQGAGGNIDDIKITCRYDLCFFDALHAVAAHDQFIKDQNWNTHEDLTEISNLVHHRSAAENAGIPYDSIDMPMPAVDGVIAVDGRVNAQALAIAAKSKGNLVPQQSASVPAVVQPLNINLPVPEATGNLVTLQNIKGEALLEKERWKLKRKIEKNESLDTYQVTTAMANFQQASDGNFSSLPQPFKFQTFVFGVGAGINVGAISLAASVVTSPIGITSFIYGGFALGFGILGSGLTFGVLHFDNPFTSANHKYKKSLRILDKIAEKIPDEDGIKHDLAELKAKVLLLGAVEKARNAFIKAAKNKKASSEKAFLARQLEFERICRDFNVPANVTSGLYAIITDRSLKCDALSTLHTHVGAASLKLRNKMEALTERKVNLALPAPKAEGGMA